MRCVRCLSVALGLVCLTGCATNNNRNFSEAAVEPGPSDPRVEQALASTLASAPATHATSATEQTKPAKPERAVKTTASKKAPKTAAETKPAKPLVTFDTTPVGRVVKVNANRQFVVLQFPLGLMPSVDRQLAVRRNGSEVGTLNVTGPQLDDQIVADIVSGECQTGDEVSAR